MNKSEGLKFISLVAQNFKNISFKEVDINGHSFVISGKNGSGKSSLIQALISPLDAKLMPTKAIKEGEERGKLEVVLAGSIGGKPQKYTIEMYFSPANENGRLVVYNEIGEKIKAPSSFIKSLMGNVSFDITDFIYAKKAERVEMLKVISGCRVEIDKINVDITNKKAERKVKKERVNSLEGAIENHGFTPAEVKLYSEKVPLDNLQQEMAGISKALENWNTVEMKQKEFEREAKNQLDIIEACDVEIERLKALIKVQEDKKINAFAEGNKAVENIKKADKWLSERTKPNAEAISEKIRAATEHNANHEKLAKHGEQQKEIAKLKSEIDSDDAEIKKLEAKIGEVIEKSQLPIKGFSFDDNEVYIDGLPMEEGQINTARIFEIGVLIAIAKNPNLKVIFLHQANLFDKENLDKVIRIAEERGYQVIAEMVAENEEVEITFKETTINE